MNPMHAQGRKHPLDAPPQTALEQQIAALQAKRLNYRLPPMDSPEDYRALLAQDPDCLFVVLRDMAARIQRHSRREWDELMYLTCCEVDLRTLGLGPAELRAQQGGGAGFACERASCTVRGMYRGTAISEKSVTALVVTRVAHAPAHLAVLVYLNRPPPPAASADAADGSHPDTDMYHDLLQVMRATGARAGCVCVFDSKQDKSSVSRARTITVRLNAAQTDMTNVLVGTQMDPRVDAAVYSGELADEASEEYLKGAREREQKYAELCAREILRDGRVFLSHEGGSAQSELRAHERLSNADVDAKIRELQRAHQEQKSEAQKRLRLAAVAQTRPAGGWAAIRR